MNSFSSFNELASENMPFSPVTVFNELSEDRLQKYKNSIKGLAEKIGESIRQVEYGLTAFDQNDDRFKDEVSSAIEIQIPALEMHVNSLKTVAGNLRNESR